MQIDLRDLIWLQTAFVGDVVLTSGAIALAAKSLPGVRQLVISTPTGCAVLKGSPFLSERIPFAKKENTWKSFREVKRQLEKAKVKPQKAVILQVHRSLRSTLLSRYLGIRTVTYKEAVLSMLADVQIKRDKSLHEALRVALLLGPFGVKEVSLNDVKPHLQALPLRNDIVWQKSLADSNAKHIAFAVGSQWGTKRWPLNYYLELASRFLENSNVTLVLLGSRDERELCNSLFVKLEKKFQVQRIFNLAGETSFDDLRRIYPKLDLLISNDSSPVHFASAFNVPTVAIFGPTVPTFGFGPLSEKKAIVQNKTLSCRPCSPHGPQSCPKGHFRCMKDLSVDVVYKAATHLLELPRS